MSWYQRGKDYSTDKTFFVIYTIEAIWCNTIIEELEYKQEETRSTFWIFSTYKLYVWNVLLSPLMIHFLMNQAMIQLLKNYLV